MPSQSGTPYSFIFPHNRGVIAKSGYNYREDPFEDLFAARGLRDAALILRLAFPLHIKWL